MKNIADASKVSAVLFGIAAFFSLASVASAHVVVTPNTAGIASYQTFTMSVPTEKNIPTIGLKLLIPAGLNYVRPNVKPGWLTQTKCSPNAAAAACKSGEAPVTEIDWIGGTIPVGQRDQFLFSAQVPAATTTLMWKAYQTYANGTVVSWDQTPGSEMGDDDSAPNGPYSQTMVVNDLNSPAPVSHDPTPIAVAALALAVVAFVMSANNSLKLRRTSW